MTLFHKYHKIYRSPTFWVTILLVCWLAGGATVSVAQENPNIPTVKVRKKPKKVQRQKKGSNRESVKDKYKAPKTISEPEGAKDRYRQPRTRSNSEKVKDDYRRPRSRSNDNKVKDEYKRPKSVPNDEKVKANDANVRQTPAIEEGQEAPQASFWQRLFNRNNPALDQGSLKRFKLPKFVEERQEKEIAHHLSEHEGQIKVLKPNIQARHQRQQANDMSGSNGPVTFRRPTQQRQIRLNEKTADDVHRFEGGIRVRTPKHQTRYFKKQSQEVHQFNGLLRVRKPQKDMHPSVVYLKSKTKSSYEQKEKFRKWKVKWYRFFKEKEHPKHLKTKTRKPRYDKNETEIWYY